MRGAAAAGHVPAGNYSSCIYVYWSLNIVLNNSYIYVCVCRFIILAVYYDLITTAGKLPGGRVVDAETAVKHRVITLPIILLYMLIKYICVI